MKIKVYGKINIALNIAGTKSGMHLIDTVMASVSLFDCLAVNEADSPSVACDLPLPGRNIAERAAEKVYEICGRHIAVDITKGIPVGGGMGGSSADAAGVLFAADKLFGLSKLCDLNAAALSLGADVPYMMRGGFCRARGFGEDLSPFDAPAGLPLLLAECGEVSTADCYRLSDTLDCPVADIDGVIAELRRDQVRGSNALLPAARILNPRIAQAEEMFAEAGQTAFLTGSGGCVFGARSNKAKAALTKAGFVCRDIEIIGRGIEILG